jgi:hypothetical protein
MSEKLLSNNDMRHITLKTFSKTRHRMYRLTPRYTDNGDESLFAGLSLGERQIPYKSLQCHRCHRYHLSIVYQ